MNASSLFRKEGVVTVAIASVMSLAFAVAMANASTTISTDVTTGGNLNASSSLAVTGASNLYGNLIVNGNATTTASSGNIATQGTLTVAGAVAASSTLQVTGAQTNYGAFTVSGTGATTLGGTLGVTDVATFTGGLISQASSTFNARLNVAGAVAATSTLQVTGATTHYGTVTNNGTLTQGSAGTAITAIQFGTCAIDSFTINATSSGYAPCTGAGTVDNNYRVFLQATSSLQAGLVLEAASSTTGAGTISIRIGNPFGNSLGGASTSTGQVGFNFWAVR